MLSADNGRGSSELLLSLQRSTKAVLFVDVVESVRLIEADEEAAIRRWLQLVAHLKSDILDPSDGRIVKTLGDGLLLEFSDAAEAVRAGLKLAAMVERESASLPPDQSMHIRLSLNFGEVVNESDDIYGREVNVAARLMTVARPGEFLATAQVRDALVSELDAVFDDMGEFRLRHVAEPVRAFRVLPKGAAPRVQPILSEEDLLPTIGVLPFSSNSIDQDDAALGSALAGDVTAALSRSGEVNVISRLSTMAFGARDLPLRRIGTALSADFVVSGRCSRDGARASLEVELTEVASDRTLWSDSIQVDESDLVFETGPVEQLVCAITRAIKKREVGRALSKPMPSLESYTLLMAAITLMHRLSPQDFELSRRLLQALVERAPRQPAPLAAMARWHVLRVVQGWTDSVEREGAEALECTRRALDLDPENVAALVAEGFVLNNLMRRLDDAERAYDLALELNPNSAPGRLLRGTLNAFRGAGSQATRDTERALHLAPLDPHLFFYQSLAASACISAEDYERALELADQSLRRNRMHTSTLRVKAVAEHRLGRFDAASETAAQLMKIQPKLTVGKWLASAPSADFDVGRAFAQSLREVGVPP